MKSYDHEKLVDSSYSSTLQSFWGHLSCMKVVRGWAAVGIYLHFILI